MTRQVLHIRKHAPTHVRFAALLFAAVLALTAIRADDIQPDPHVAPPASSMGIEAAALDGSSRAIRDVNIPVVAERVSERKAASDFGFDAGGARQIGGHSPARDLVAAAGLKNAAPPRILFYLHGALLI